MLEDVLEIRRVVPACETVDLRKGIDGIAMIIGDKYKPNPFEKAAGINFDFQTINQHHLWYAKK